MSLERQYDEFRSPFQLPMPNGVDGISAFVRVRKWQMLRWDIRMQKHSSLDIPAFPFNSSRERHEGRRRDFSSIFCRVLFQAPAEKKPRSISKDSSHYARNQMSWLRAYKFKLNACCYSNVKFLEWYSIRLFHNTRRTVMRREARVMTINAKTTHRWIRRVFKRGETAESPTTQKTINALRCVRLREFLPHETLRCTCGCFSGRRESPIKKFVISTLAGTGPTLEQRWMEPLLWFYGSNAPEHLSTRFMVDTLLSSDVRAPFMKEQLGSSLA